MTDGTATAGAEAAAGFAQAMALYRQNDLRAARALCEEVLAASPDHYESLQLMGVIHMREGQPAEGHTLFRRALAANPLSAQAHSNLGNALRRLRRFAEALACYDRAITLSANFAEAHNNRGNVLRDLGRPAEALASYERALALRPRFEEADRSRAALLAQRPAAATADAMPPLYRKAQEEFLAGRLDAALALYDSAIAGGISHAAVHNERGIVLQKLGRHADALACYEKAIALSPSLAEAWNNRGAVLKLLGRFDAAIASYDRALSEKPGFADAWRNRALSLAALNRFAEALENCDKAIAARPQFVEAHCERAAMLSALGRHGEAAEAYGEALKLRPNHAETHNNRGVAFLNMVRPKEAKAEFERALELAPDYAEAMNNKGVALATQRLLAEAIAAYDKALAIRPDFVDAHNNRGVALAGLNRFKDAIASYDKAVALRPGFAQAHFNRAAAFKRLQRHAEAIAGFAEALKLSPHLDYAAGEYINEKLQLCDWTDMRSGLDALQLVLREGKLLCQPWIAIGLFDSPALQLAAARTYAAAKYPAALNAPAIIRKPAEKIRIGYYSSDFREHAVSYLMAELFEVHDKSSFELHAYSFGPDRDDAMKQRVASAVDHFTDVAVRTDDEIIRISRLRGIDIAVNLNGYTQNERTGIFAGRAAPVQVNYIGYPGTMGAPYIDYIIADKTLISDKHRPFYSESVVYMPGGFQVNDSKRRISERAFTRAELGLPEKGFVFCCFNRSYKIMPVVFDSWMRILRQVEGSVLWLYADNDTAAANLRKEAAARGVEPERLVFGGKLPREDYLARYKLADLFLDTRPYNAGTTASDALWAGLPVLTCTGNAFASRMGTSLLTTMALPELVAQSATDYEAKAVNLAKAPNKLRQIRTRIERKRLSSPLFDANHFARHLEAAFREMLRRHDAGLRPGDITIDRLGRATSRESGEAPRAPQK